MNTRSQTQAPARSSTPGALLRFLFDAMSGMGAAKLGWEMVTDPKAKLSDIAIGVSLCRLLQRLRPLGRFACSASPNTTSFLKPEPLTTTEDLARAKTFQQTAQHRPFGMVLFAPTKSRNAWIACRKPPRTWFSRWATRAPCRASPRACQTVTSSDDPRTLAIVGARSPRMGGTPGSSCPAAPASGVPRGADFHTLCPAAI